MNLAEIKLHPEEENNKKNFFDSFLAIFNFIVTIINDAQYSKKAQSEHQERISSLIKISKGKEYYVLNNFIYLYNTPFSYKYHIYIFINTEKHFCSTCLQI